MTANNDQKMVLGNNLSCDSGEGRVALVKPMVYHRKDPFSERCSKALSKNEDRIIYQTLKFTWIFFSGLITAVL